MPANQLVNPAWTIKEIGRRLVNELRFGANANRSYDDQYKVQGAKVGYTVNARLPQRYKVTKGQAMQATPVQDRIVPISLTDQAHVGLEFTTASLTMEVDAYRERYLNPAVDALVNQADFDGLQRMYQAVFMTVGTPAVVPGSTGTLPAAANLVYMNAVTKLVEGAVPKPFKAMLSPNMHTYLASANFTLFNPSGEITKLYRTGQFSGEAMGIKEWYMDQNVATHVAGPLGGTPLVDGASQTGSSLLTKGWTGAAARRLNVGDVIQIAGVYAINPMNYQSTGRLQDFVVTSNFDSDGSGNGTVGIYPPITVTGENQTVTASPADSAAITIFGHASSYAGLSTPQGLVYHQDAFAFVMADLEMPGGLWVAERIQNKALGIAVRFLKDYDIRSDESPARVDILYGWKAVRPEFACRICA